MSDQLKAPREALAAVKKHGTIIKAAAALGVPRHTLSNRLAALAVAAALPDPPVDDIDLTRALLSKRGVRMDAAALDKAQLERLLERQDAGEMIEAHLDGSAVIARRMVEAPHRATFDAPSAKVYSPDGHYRFGVATDMHLGSKYERLEELHDFYRICREEGVQIVLNAGNWIDGEIARINGPDLHTHGLDGQIEYLCANYPQLDGIQTWAIWGDDHESWFGRNAGVDMGRYAERAMRAHGREDWRNLGYMERDVELMLTADLFATPGPSCRLRLVHPGGGSAYAVSYTMQKLIESYDGGDKPAALVAGHYHKMDAGIYRNTWYVQGGCFQSQTPFMRKKKLSAAVGGVIVDYWQDESTGALLSQQVKMIRYFERNYTGKVRYSITEQPELPSTVRTA